jgi:ABC-2 type transport system ATP-binding protein
MVLGDMQAIDAGLVGGGGERQSLIEQPCEGPAALFDVIEKSYFHCRYFHPMHGARRERESLLLPRSAVHATSARVMSVPPPIKVEHLVKIYKKLPAVDRVSFSIAPGTITGLLGGNGAGKTTTIAMIMGLITPTSGLVRVFGAQMPNQRYQVLHRMNFESPYVEMPMRLTIRQNLTVFGMLYGVPDLAERIEELGAALDLSDLLDRPTGKLSAGQKTRVSLAKALINSPELLLLDEPTASLDPDTADWVRASLDRYRRQRQATVLLASHNMAEVERLCERVIIMKRGRIEDDDTPPRLLARYGRRTLEEVFLDVARGRAEERVPAQ